MASTSLTESEAAFKKQAAHLGLSDEWIQGLVGINVNNMGKLAFACSQPGQPATDADVTQLLTNTGVVRLVTVGDIAILKRLIFEAQTAVISLVRSQADPNADPSARKLPAAERNARIEAQRTRLRGMTLEGPLEVAHSLYDMISGMMESDSLKYIPPSKCLTRMSEITAAKPPKELKLDANSTEPLADGTRPLDRIVEDLEKDHSVVYYLLPTPLPAKDPKPPKNPKKEDNWTQYHKKGAEVKKWNDKGQWKKSGSSGSGKLPYQLRGCASATPDGSRICFAYNIGGCNDADDGGQCRKGVHLCAGKGCHQKHPIRRAPRSDEDCPLRGKGQVRLTEQNQLGASH